MMRREVQYGRNNSVRLLFLACNLEPTPCHISDTSCSKILISTQAHLGMTRYNNLGLKRKYEEATQYREEPEAGPSNATLPVAQDEHGANDQASDVPKKKKRKRGKSRKSQVDGNVQEAGGEDTNGNSNLPPGESNAKKSAHGKKKPGTKAEKGKRKLREARGESS